MDKLEYERKHLEKGCKYIAGIDEVGRGPLAGPVVCACVIMPLDDVIDGVDDSKKLSEKKREKLNEIILSKAIAVSICQVDEKTIDEINILQATRLCMKNCVESLSQKPDVLFVDALKLDVDAPQVSIIKGDFKSYTIGCASIVAKVYRDKLMEKYDEIYPEYGFKKHKGYGTKAHIDAIREVGPCSIHRMTFIKNFWDGKGKI